MGISLFIRISTQGIHEIRMNLEGLDTTNEIPF